MNNKLMGICLTLLCSMSVKAQELRPQGSVLPTHTTPEPYSLKKWSHEDPLPSVRLDFDLPKKRVIATWASKKGTDGQHPGLADRAKRRSALKDEQRKLNQQIKSNGDGQTTGGVFAAAGLALAVDGSRKKNAEFWIGFVLFAAGGAWGLMCNANANSLVPQAQLIDDVLENKEGVELVEISQEYHSLSQALPKK